jgi:hypothetical protein
LIHVDGINIDSDVNIKGNRAAARGNGARFRAATDRRRESTHLANSGNG